jgi:inosine-uridine nucleoside N-ribohydrolase
MTITVLHDCDPGNDDAVAILAGIGHEALDLVAVTTGAGHLTFERTAENAAITVAVAGAAIPVSAGAHGPLLRERLIARILDMEHGLDPERGDLPAVKLDDLHSIDRIAREAAAHPGLTVVATGPLTNLALAIRRYPELTGTIGRIVTLSGAWGLGTKSAAAEWNILCDPEAAAIVYGAGIPVTMVPVDASGTVPITDALVAEVKSIGGSAPRLAAELLRSLQSTHHAGLFGSAEAPLHDPCAMLVAAQPAIATIVKARVDIDTTQGLNYGRTIVDFAGRSEVPANCDVVIAFDVVATHRALVRALRSLSIAVSPEGQAGQVAS